MDAVQNSVIEPVSEWQKALRLADEIQTQLEAYGVRLVDSPAGTAFTPTTPVSDDPATGAQG